MNFSIIGSGNIASWLAYVIHRNGEKIDQVYSRCYTHASSLATRYGAEPIDDISRLNDRSDIYIFTLNDTAYHKVLKDVKFNMNLAVHTSGSLSQELFKGFASHYGVIYPYQSISAGMDYSGITVPLCIEADNEQTLAHLRHIAGSWTDQVYEIGEADRGYLHLAAVFSCNFVNALYGVGYDILKYRNIDPDIMKPLLQNTLQKLDFMSPSEAQTGPAVRHEFPIMEKHLGMLKTEELKEVYRLISSLIQVKNAENDNTDKV